VKRVPPLAGLASGVILLSIGFFPLFAQSLLFRSFLSQFEGHEFAVGCFFGSWLIWLGAGGLLVLLAGGRVDRLLTHVPLLVLAYLPAYALQSYVLMNARQLAGVQAYEFFPLGKVLVFSLLGNAPLSLLTGFLFTLACSWTGQRRDLPLARVYALESLGSFAGGVAVTIMLTAGMEPETAFGWAALLTGIAVLFYQLATRSWRPAVLPLAIAVLAAAGLFLGAGRQFAATGQADTWQRLLPGGRCTGAFTTPQGTYLFGFYKEQFNVVFGEAPCETVPDLEHASEVVAAHLAQKPDTRSVLVIGPGSLAICQRLLDLPQITRVTWLSTDPAYPARLLQALPAGFRKNTDRLDAQPLEIRAALQGQPGAYDLVIVNLPDATSLALNRYFTGEFFALAKRSLRPQGVLSVRISGGENYLGGQLANLGASACLSLQAHFRRLALKPGDESWLLASDDADLSDQPELLAKRFASIAGSGKLYPLEGIATLYPADRIQFQMARYKRTIKKVPEQILVNSDAQPKAMLNALLLALQQAGRGEPWSTWIMTFSMSGIWIVLAGFVIFVCARASYLSRTPQPAGATLLAPSFLVFSTGLAGMAVSVILMFFYQVRFGSLATHIGLLSALFMLGLFGGSRIVEMILLSRPQLALPVLRSGVLLHLALLALLAGLPEDAPRSALCAAVLAAGILTGLYVPIAAQHMRLARGLSDRASSIIFLIADNLGGAAGGILTALVLVPAIGTTWTLLTLGLLLSLNLIVVTPGSLAPGVTPVSDWFDRFSRPVAYTLFAVVAFWLAAAHIFHATALEKKGPPLLSAARSMLRDTGLRPELPAEQQKQEQPFYIVRRPNGDMDSLVFSSASYGPALPGYGGRMVLGVRVTPEGRVLDLRVIESRETPAYLARVRPWLKTLAGRDVGREDWLKADGVSGATITSDAVLRNLQSAGPRFAADVLKPAGPSAPPAPLRTKPDWRVLIFILLTVLGLISHYVPSRNLRRISLIVIVCGAGLYLNIQFSLDQVYCLLGLQLPSLGSMLAFLMCVFIPVLVLLFGNIYCGHLCPFGAVQELVAELRPRRWLTDPPVTIWRYSRALKYLVLAAALVWFGAGLERGFSSVDPLVTVFSRDCLVNPSLFILLLLALSFFFRRFWCRNLCPAGAFLSLFNGVRLLSRLIPPTQPAHCDLGVRHARDLDCLHCDRCIIAAQAPEVEALEVSRVWSRILRFALLLAALAGAVVLVQRGGDVHNEWVAQQPVEAAAAGRISEKEEHKARAANLPAIRQLIEQSQLSSHEASHYKPYVPPPEEEEP
jgi:spermidine synthase